MDQREFNRSMDNYIKERKSKKSSKNSSGIFSGIKDVFSIEIYSDEKPKEPVEQEPDNVPVEEVQKVMRGENKSAPVDEDFDEEAFVEAHKPKGFWTSFKQMLFGSYSEDELLADQEQDVAVIERPGDVDDDVKEMLRTCVSWINRLPAEEISRIKRSAEYDEFKDLLRKYKLIKE